MSSITATTDDGQTIAMHTADEMKIMIDNSRKIYDTIALPSSLSSLPVSSSMICSKDQLGMVQELLERNAVLVSGKL